MRNKFQIQKFCRWALSEKNGARYNHLLDNVHGFIKINYTDRNKPISTFLLTRFVKINVIRLLCIRYVDEVHKNASGPPTIENIRQLSVALVEHLLINYKKTHAIKNEGEYNDG